MLKFNNTHIITGQIKQLLADFNLPRYRVYTSAMAEYAKNNNGKESPEVLFTIKKNTADESTI